MASTYKPTQVEKDMRKHDVNILQTKKKKVKKVAGVKMPMNVDDDLKTALMWYYISWYNKIELRWKWNMQTKQRYAKEVSDISAAIPIHLIGRNNDNEQVAKILADLKIKLFGYEAGKFILLNEKGEKVQEMTGTNLYALLVFLVDSLSSGLENQPGFDFIKLAKAVMKRDMP